MRSLCTEIETALAEGKVCQVDRDAAVWPTDVVYPSFDQVCVRVVRVAEGFRVSDGGGAVSSAIIHGREDGVIENAIKAAAQRFGVEAHGAEIAVVVPSLEWMRSAVMGVANASAHAAHAAVDHVAKAREAALHERIYTQLAKVVPESRIKKGFEYRGESGRTWKAEYAVIGSAAPVLVRGVVPHPTSIVHAYAGFGDLDHAGGARAIAVHDQPLSADDAALLRQVADVVSLSGVGKAASQAVH